MILSQALQLIGFKVPSKFECTFATISFLLRRSLKSFETCNSVSCYGSMSSGPCNEGGQHRRENTFGRMVKDREEDLALFQNMRTREHNYFNDDIEASLSTKFGGMSGYQMLVPSTPARKMANDLLTSESGKHDYDWLLTPPGTPLFPSLDHEKPNPTRFHQNLPTLLGSSTKASRLASGLSHSSSKVVRSIASPRQPSSPSSISMMNGISVIRSSFAPMSTVSPGSRPSTPSRRPSTPTPTRPSTPTARPSSPMKKPLTPTARPSTPTTRPSTPSARPSTPTARPSTPTARPSIPSTRSSIPSTRSSTPTARPCTPTVRSSAQASRPTTPTLRRTPTSSVGSSVKAKPSPCLLNGSPNIRPSSPSRKIQPMLPAMPGLFSDPPPNLRTTLPQRSSSTSRGASVSSRPGGNGSGHKSDAKDVISRSGQRAISPSPSRGYSSSASHDHDHSSSHSSRDSAISPFIEKVETARALSTQSRIHSESLTNRFGRANEDTTTCKIPLNSKKPVRPSAAKESSFFGGSISKKSIDTAVRHMDVRRSTPSGFRPLMSNGPVSSFYTRTSSLLRRPGSPLFNPSISNASNFGSANVSIAGCEDKVRDLSAEEMPRDLDKGSSGTQILTLDEENGSQSSEAQRSNEVDEEPVLDCSESQVENLYCQKCPQFVILIHRFQMHFKKKEHMGMT
ncbi:hypothetical protein O6H91_05G103200 [Diphasiastrum complanatum]|uniref:Uncharacterized protein n=3 Tax=Diphasiastrum complanatum TaxID=34168 RepID=A0ACC2DRG3_DIPCM|nr:hypothetical protein O6H91_05G103200 [Diphasiastrum complanatum]